MGSQMLTCPYCGQVWADHREADLVEDENVDDLQGDLTEQGVCPECLSLHLLL